MSKLKLLFLAAGVVALAWMVWRLGPGVLWAGLRQIGPWLAVGCALHGAGLVCDSITLRACVVGRKPTLRHLIRTSVSGHAINEASPFGKVGEVTKYELLGEVMPKEDAAAALVAQNLVMFTVNCALIAVAPTVTALLVGAPRAGVITFAAIGAVFLAIGAGCLWLSLRGIGRWPFWLLRRLPFKAGRVDRWEKKFEVVEGDWTRAMRDRRSVAIAYASGVVSRLCNVAESALYFGLGGGDHIVAGAFLSLAGSVAVGFAMFFVPFGAGSAEVGADTVFRLAGLSSVAGVLVELARKLRRIVFVTIGVVLLGVGGRHRPRRGPVIPARRQRRGGRRPGRDAGREASRSATSRGRRPGLGRRRRRSAP